LAINRIEGADVQRRTAVLRTAVLAAVLGLSVSIAAPAIADNHKDSSCTTGSYTGTAKMFYVSYNSTHWRLTQTQYKLTPADSSSDQNNINQKLFGGSASAGLGNQGNGLRDGNFHVHWDQSYSVNNYFAQKGNDAYVSQEAIFDKFGTDPRCTTKIYFP
jgi:hypothetical protein